MYIMTIILSIIANTILGPQKKTQKKMKLFVRRAVNVAERGDTIFLSTNKQTNTVYIHHTTAGGAILTDRASAT